MRRGAAARNAHRRAPVQVSPSGEVLDALFDTTGARVSSVSAVTEHDGSLFIGNLAGDYVSVLPLD